MRPRQASPSSMRSARTSTPATTTCTCTRSDRTSAASSTSPPGSCCRSSPERRLRLVPWRGDRGATGDPNASRRESSPTDTPAVMHAAVADGRATLPEVRARGRGRRARDLWERATQTVFGAGPAPARRMLVGEQPGDREDVEVAPFVGPGGRVLDDALVEAGIDRERAFVTNVVKHFKWRPSPGGKRRLHERPTVSRSGPACPGWRASSRWSSREPSSASGRPRRRHSLARRSG